jgi:hypothetical protein
VYYTFYELSVPYLRETPLNTGYLNIPDLMSWKDWNMFAEESHTLPTNMDFYFKNRRMAVS